MAREYAETERMVTRTYRRDRLRIALELFVWCVIGLVFVGLAFHTTDYKTGQIYFYLGLVVGYGGMLCTLILAYRRGEDGGDW